MISLTVKTLDGRSHEFSVEDDCTVDQFKVLAEGKLGVPTSKQRLIFMGRALQDGQPLKEYGVSDKVIHLVERAPPPSGASAATDSGSAQSSSVPPQAGAPQPQHAPGAAGAGPEPFLANLVAGLLSSLSGAAGAAGTGGPDGAGPSLNVQINMDVFHTGGPGHGPMPTSQHQAGASTAPASGQAQPPNTSASSSQSGRTPHATASSRTSQTAGGRGSSPSAAAGPQPDIQSQIQAQQRENMLRGAHECMDCTSHYLSHASRHMNRLEDGSAARQDVLDGIRCLEIPALPTAPESSSQSSSSTASASASPGAASSQQSSTAPAAGHPHPDTPSAPPRAETLSAVLRRQLLPMLRCMIPAVEQCADILDRPEAQTSGDQQVLDNVMEAVHSLSHSFASLADLDVDVRAAGPRDAVMSSQRALAASQAAGSASGTPSSSAGTRTTPSASSAAPTGGIPPWMPAGAAPSSQSASTSTSTSAAAGGQGQPSGGPGGMPFPLPAGVMLPPAMIQGMMAAGAAMMGGAGVGGGGGAAGPIPAPNFGHMPMASGGAMVFHTEGPVAAPQPQPGPMSSQPPSSSGSNTARPSATTAASAPPSATGGAHGSVPMPAMFPVGGQGFAFGPPPVRIQSRAQVISPVAGRSLINQCPHVRHNSLRPASAPRAPHVHFVPQHNVIIGAFPGIPMHVPLVPGQPAPPTAAAPTVPTSSNQSAAATATPASSAPASRAQSSTAGTAASRSSTATARAQPSGSSSSSSSRAGGNSAGSGDFARAEPQYDSSNSHRFTFQFDDDGQIIATNVLPPEPEQLRRVMQDMYPQGLPPGETDVSAWRRLMAQTEGAQLYSNIGDSPAPSDATTSPSPGGHRSRLPSGFMAGLYQQVLNPRQGVSVRNVVRDLGAEDEDDEDAGPLSVLMSVLCDVLSLPEILAIVDGCREPLNRAGPVLYAALHEDVLDPDLPYEQALTVASNRVAADFEDSVREALVVAQAQEGVRICETALQEIRQVALVIFRTIHDTDPDSENYGDLLARPIRREISDALAVLAHGLVDERNSLHLVLQRFVEYCLRSNEGGDAVAMMSPMFYYSTLHQAVDRARVNSRLTSEELDARLIRNRTASSASPATVAPARANSAPAAVSASAPMSAPAVVGAGSGRAGSASSPATGVEPGDDDDWHGMVPASWVPVIAEDIIRQRLTPSRRPHSDGYASTQSSNKRRKTSSTSSGAVGEKLPAAVQQAIRDAGTEPISSVADVASAVREDPQLQETYEPAVRDIVMNRVRSDPEYSGERYPHLGSLFG